MKTIMTGSPVVVCVMQFANPSTKEGRRSYRRFKRQDIAIRAIGLLRKRYPGIA